MQITQLSPFWHYQKAGKKQSWKDIYSGKLKAKLKKKLSEKNEPFLLLLNLQFHFGEEFLIKLTI